MAWSSVIALSLIVGCTQAQTPPINCSNIESGSCGRNSSCNQELCQCDSTHFSPTGMNNDCISQNEPDQRCVPYDPECVYCGSTFAGPCERCTHFIQGTTCINDCVDITIIVLSNSLTSRICNDKNAEDRAGLPEWAIIVFAVVGVVIVLIAVGSLIGFSVLILNRSSHGRFDVEDLNPDIPKSESPAGTLRTKRSNSFSYRQEDKETSERVQHNPTYDDTDADEETKFMHKLDYLRTQAEIFLKMLNDMRRRLKELSPDAPAAQQYRNVMRDVTRLLYLLNKKPSNVEMPADGITLLDWSEKILNRYLKSQGIPPKPYKATNRLSVLGPQDETHF